MTSDDTGQSESPERSAPDAPSGMPTPDVATPDVATPDVATPGIPMPGDAGSRHDPPDRPELRDHRALLVAVVSGATAADALAGLRLLGGLRAHLDETERALIESAREGGASWAAVAGALALTSRQAAEQRWLRLSGAVGRSAERARADRHRQQKVDTKYGVPVARLRAAARAVERCLRADPVWIAGRPAAGLARATLAAAGEAPPGGLYDLVRDALRDLGGVPEVDWPAPVRVAVDRLRAALGEATPGRS